MSSSQPLIRCPNPECPSPMAPIGLSCCPSCQTKFPYRYLWATGDYATQIPIGSLVADRYYVTAPQVWLDTRPGLLPLAPPILPEEVIPYLNLYPYRLHIPEVFGFTRRQEFAETSAETATEIPDILLLENAPLSAKGEVLPALKQVWRQTTAVRQVYWLWQLLQLWPALKSLGVASSLLVADNIRVEGWRVRLQQLYKDVSNLPVSPAVDRHNISDEEGDTTVGTLGDAAPPISDLGIEFVARSPLTQLPTLSVLGDFWLPLAREAQPTVSEALQGICQILQGLQASASEEIATVPAEIFDRLNRLLLEQSAQLPLQLQVSALTDQGPQRSHNEDACFPTPQDLQPTSSSTPTLLPYLTIVCDGIGGHEGGEVASQMAIQALKLQMQAFLSEIDQQTEPLSPTLIAEQLQASIRVVNNLISAQNNLQGREAKQRMGTTLVMALQAPQKIRFSSGAVLPNAHELYVAHVGDSRAYWITASQCCLITLDDDVAVREVRLGRNLYQDALQRHDAGALTQALGTRDADFLHPSVQRLMIEEDGLLLLCSDGLSDNGWIEESWETYCKPVLEDKLPLEWAVQALVDLGNQKNGYDNTSVVMTYCRISAPHVSRTAEVASLTRADGQEVPLSDASRALLYGETAAEPEAVTMPELNPPRVRNYILLGLLAFLLITGAVGLAAWWQTNRLPQQPPIDPSPPVQPSP